MTNNKRPVTIGVAGGTGSGKTTVSHQILERVGEQHIAYLAHDSYYKDLAHLPYDERRAINFDHPDSLDTALLIDHVKQLQNNHTADVPIYDFTQHIRIEETEHIPAQPIILV